MAVSSFHIIGRFVEKNFTKSGELLMVVFEFTSRDVMQRMELQDRGYR
jgi:hypothetical protein